MKLKHLFFAALAAAAVMVGCTEKENPNSGKPAISLDQKEVSLEQKAGSQAVVKLTSTRDWKVNVSEEKNLPEWLQVDPMVGAAGANQEITIVAAKENTEFDRSYKMTFTIGMFSQTLTVNQKGAKGSFEDKIIYKNDFDKEAAKEPWPYLDKTDAYMNQIGKGAAKVRYASHGITLRNNANSDGGYSDYKEQASGMNNLFFGKQASFAVKGLALNGAENITITFGTEKFSKENGNEFTPGEFHLYLSNDAEKWAEVVYSYEGTPGRWNLANGTYKVAGSDSLHVGVIVDVASSYRMDDLTILVSSEEGTAVDFAGGKEIPELSDPKPINPDELTLVTVADFIAKGQADDKGVYKLSGVLSDFREVSETSKFFGFTINQDGAAVIAAFPENFDAWKDQIRDHEGGLVTVYGTYDYYADKKQHQIKDATIIAYDPDYTVPGLENATIAEIIAADAMTPVTTQEMLVVATHAQGYVISDGTDYLLAFAGEAGHQVKVGDQVVVKGTKDFHNSLTQISDAVATVKSSGNAVELGTPLDITETIGSFDAKRKVTFISYTGMLKVGEYKGHPSYNIIVSANEKDPQGSISYPDAALSTRLDGLNNAKIKVTGFYVGGTSFLTTVVTSVDPVAFIAADVAKLEFLAEGGEKTFNVNASADTWTVSCDNAAFTVVKEGKTVKVTVAENTKTQALQGTITLTLGDKTATVAVSQAPAVAGPQFVKVTENLADWSGKYLIVMNNAAHATISGKDLAKTADVTIEFGAINYVAALDDATVTVAKSGNGYTITLPNGNYFGPAHNSCASVKSTETAPVLGLEWTAGGVKISGDVSGKTEKYYLYNSSNKYFRCYVDKNGQKGYTFPDLYKLNK